MKNENDKNTQKLKVQWIEEDNMVEMKNIKSYEGFMWHFCGVYNGVKYNNYRYECGNKKLNSCKAQMKVHEIKEQNKQILKIYTHESHSHLCAPGYKIPKLKEQIKELYMSGTRKPFFLKEKLKIIYKDVTESKISQVLYQLKKNKQKK